MAQAHSAAVPPSRRGSPGVSPPFQPTSTATMAEADPPAATDAAPEKDGEGDYFYVCEKTLKAVREKLSKGEEISQETVSSLAFPDNLADDETMVPVDMSGAGGDYDDVEDMVQQLGPKGAAEAFVKAADHFEKTKESLPEEDRPKPMTAAEWKQVLAEEEDLEGEEEDDLEGDEEELLDEGEGEEEEGDEPPAKKAKQS
uniref:Uncharacterized protein n=1 Tax=Alexandrium andersonii TaxID=327968 RepID=A0A7S2CCQ9_9DINO